MGPLGIGIGGTRILGVLAVTLGLFAATRIVAGAEQLIRWQGRRR